MIAKLEAYGFSNNAYLTCLVASKIDLKEEALIDHSVLGKSYTDNNIHYAFGSNLEVVKQTLSQDLLKLLEWFYENCILLSPEKCHYMYLRANCVTDLLRFYGEDLEATELETILRI